MAYLALGGRVGGVQRTTLAELLWIDAHPEAARRNLRQELHQLKSSALSALLELTPEAVALRGPLECDLFQFEREGEDPQQALTLYRGTLLEGLYVPGAGGFEEWLERRRAELHTRWLELKRARVAQLEANGFLHEALLELTLLLETPNEALHREAMRLPPGWGSANSHSSAPSSSKPCSSANSGCHPTPKLRRCSSGCAACPLRRVPLERRREACIGHP